MKGFSRAFLGLILVLLCNFFCFFLVFPRLAHGTKQVLVVPGNSQGKAFDKTFYEEDYHIKLTFCLNNEVTMAVIGSNKAYKGFE